VNGIGLPTEQVVDGTTGDVAVGTECLFSPDGGGNSFFTRVVVTQVLDTFVVCESPPSLPSGAYNVSICTMRVCVCVCVVVHVWWHVCGWRCVCVFLCVDW